LSTIIRSVVLRLQLDIRQLIINHLTNAILVKTKKKGVLNTLIVNSRNVYTIFVKVKDILVSVVTTIVKIRYTVVYYLFMALYHEYLQIVRGNLNSKHICMFLLLGFYVDNRDYFYWVIIMALSSRAELYVLKHLASSYPYLSRFFAYLLRILFAVSLAICVDCILTSIILPIFHKFILSLKEKYSGILKMAGGSPKITDTGGSGNNDPTPNPKANEGYTGYSKDNKKKDRNLEEYYTYDENYDHFLKKVKQMQNYS
jgi:hypothetical protein